MCLQKWYSTDGYLTGYTTSFVCVQYSMGISLRLRAEFSFLRHDNSLGFQCCGDVATINEVLILGWILPLILSSFWRIFLCTWWDFKLKVILKLINLFSRKKKNKLRKRKFWNFPSFTLGIHRLYIQPKLPLFWNTYSSNRRLLPCSQSIFAFPGLVKTLKLSSIMRKSSKPVSQHPLSWIVLHFTISVNVSVH